jgi:phosphoglycolate phosphatase-like HAD superfamily hydrolase
MELLDETFAEEGLGQVPSGLFSPVVTRDCLGGINKPSGAVAAAILSTWAVAPSDAQHCLFVGDSGDDVLCGRNAGTQTCLITNRDEGSGELEGPELGTKGETYTLAGLGQLLSAVIESNFAHSGGGAQKGVGRGLEHKEHT